jgi:hypothetical protein
MTLIDDKSRKTWVYFLKKKSEALSKFRIFTEMVELETGKKIKRTRTDGGGEYMSTAFKNYLQERGIRRQSTTANTPQSNGVAERMNRSLLEKARSMMQAASVPRFLWAEAISTATYLLNRSPTHSSPNTTSEGTYTKHRPNLSNIRIFGSKTYVHIHKDHRDKLASTAIEGILLGIDSEKKAYRCYIPSQRQVIISRDVRIDESQFSSQTLSSSSAPLLDSPSHVSASSSPLLPMPSIASSSSPRFPHSSHFSGPDDHIPPSISFPTPPSITTTIPSAASTSSTQPPLLPLPSILPKPPQPSARPQRIRSAPYKLQDYAAVATTVDEPPDLSCPPIDWFALQMDVVEELTQRELASFAEATKDPLWQAAMEQEIDNLKRNQTWELVPPTPGQKPISVKWVFRLKHIDSPHGESPRFKHKARLVARGFEQHEGVDFYETFAPVVKWVTIRCVIALSAHFGWTCHHLDVKTAFLNSQLSETVLMYQPPGFTTPGEQADWLCLLRRALYGLRQSPRAWYGRIDTYLRKLGLTRNPADHNLYHLQEGGLILILVLYVDDLMISGNHTSKIHWLIQQLEGEFEMTNLGQLHMYLNVDFITTSSGIFMSQQRYIIEMLADFGMTSCKAAVTPLPEGFKADHDDASGPTDPEQYRRIVDKLLYLTNSRPDLAYNVGVISRFMSKPNKTHLDMARHILRYVHATCSFGIQYRRGGNFDLRGYTDADWAGDILDRKSTSGYFFQLGEGPISWCSKKQPTVALSSTEAEYRVLTEGAKEATWLRLLLNNLGMFPDSTVMIMCDNMSCMKIARNPVFHARTKHVEVHYHYIREKLLSGEIDLQYLSTKDQVADILTKSLGKIKFWQFRKLLGVEPEYEVKQRAQLVEIE